MWRLRWMLLAALSIGPGAAQPLSRQEYAISIGTPSEAISSGTIWLYSYSWYGLEKYKLAAIEKGRAMVPLDIERLKRELDPHPNTDGYVVVLQIGEHQWYRSPDVRPEALWSDLPAAVNSLGQAIPSSTGKTQLILPPLAKRHITLLYTDGHPAVNADIPVSIYVWDTNHCGVHQGLPLGTFRTDRTGTFEVQAPLVSLYLDVNYYEIGDIGPAGLTYSDNSGLRTDPEPNLVLKKKWQFTDEDNLSYDAELKVLTAGGSPRKGVDVFGSWSTNTCGGGYSIGQTDASDVAKIRLDPTFGALELIVGGPLGAEDPEADANTRELSDDELREILSKHKLTIRW